MPTLRISTDPAELDVSMIHRFLSEQSYWASGITRALVEKSIAHSICFGGYIDGSQVAFARVVTDRATFAHLKDVFVLPAFRGHGYGIAIMRAVMSHPDLCAVAFTLGTGDAHELYERFGFTPLPAPERSMLRSGTFLKRADG
jgi:GNAT superfamily N-acetyltransferase